MAEFEDRLFYTGLERIYCRDCGYTILRHESSSDAMQLCSRCSEDLLDFLSRPDEFHIAGFYRALRPDENMDGDLCPEDRNMNVSLEYHVTWGSWRETQYISMTISIKVAMFFAIKGAIDRNHIPARVALVNVKENVDDGDDYGTHRAYLPRQVHWNGNQRAQNFARVFQEVVVDGSICNGSVPYCRVDRFVELNHDEIDLFRGWTEHFADFSERYDSDGFGSNLERRFNDKDPEVVATIHTKLVGLRHYLRAIETLQIDNRLTCIFLEREPENAHDENAISVWATSVLASVSKDNERVRIGYICREHASVLSDQVILNEFLYQSPCSLRIEDLKNSYEVPLEIRVITRKSIVLDLTHNLNDAAGSLTWVWWRHG